MFRILNQEIGETRLSDGTIIFLRVAIADIREAGFSPFGGINFVIKAVGGIAARSPLELKQQVKDKPISVGPEPPKDGWELVDIVEQKPAIEEVIILSSKKEEYLVKVASEITMISRNMNYKNEFDEPIYWATWTYKFSWKKHEKIQNNRGE